MLNLGLRPGIGGKRPRIARVAAFAIIGVVTILVGVISAHAEKDVLTTSPAELKSALQSGDPYVRLKFDGTVNLTSTLNLFLPNTVIDATGQNVTFNGGNSLRILNVASGKSCTVSNVIFSSGKITATNGVNGANGSNGSGNNGGNGGTGGVGFDGKGGAIQNLGTLNLVNCTLMNNTVIGGNGGSGGNGGNSLSGIAGSGGNGGNGGNGFGGAVLNQGTLVLTNCYLANNSAVAGNAGAGGTNGTGGLAYPGNGGIGGTGAGGCVYSSTGSSATLINCTFAFSSAQGGTSQPPGPPNGSGNGNNGPAGGSGVGGGVCNVATGATLINCTFYQNNAVGGNGANGGSSSPSGFNGGNGGNGGSAIGAGLYNGASVTVANCTFSGGTTTGGTNGLGGFGNFSSGASGSPGFGAGDSLGNAPGATLNLQSSLLAYAQDAGLNAYGTITDQGSNISSDNTPASLGVNSRKNTDPKLDVLDFNGGPNTNLLTIGLLFGSPALSFGATPLLPFDERGVARPSGASDAGSFESTVLHNISGNVVIGSSVLSSVGLTASNASAVVTTSTDPNGNYTFNYLANGTYTLSVNAFYTNSSGKLTNAFVPASTNVSLSGSDVPNVNFTATTGGLQRIKGLGSLTNLTNHALLVSFQVLSNRVYRIQSNTNLAGTNWVTVATNGSGNA